MQNILLPKCIFSILKWVCSAVGVFKISDHKFIQMRLCNINTNQKNNIFTNSNTAKSKISSVSK